MLCVNGDTIVDLDFRSFIQAHARYGATASLVVSTRADQPHVGGVAIRLDAWVDDILEAEQDRNAMIIPQRHLRYGANSGVYVMDKQRLVVDWPVEFRTGKSETGILRHLARRRCLWAYDNGARYLLDFGTPERWRRINNDLSIISQFFPL